MRDVYNRYRPLIPDSKELKMKIDLDVPNPVFGFETDKRLLNETLEILTDNAIKYTPKGEVSIGYEMIRNESVRFIVSDTGIGIPEDEMENIFSRFYRISNEINELTSGSGLGLPIAQHYVMLLGGELNLESTPEKGTTFWFTLPFREGKGFLKVVS
jgi:signal transduction histidine kinase